MTLTRFAIPALLLAAVGCVNTEYIGRRYPPTTRVDLYFDRNEVKVEHEVIGRLQSKADESTSLQEIQADMEKTAMENGGDAIVIEGMGVIETGSSTSTSGATETKPKKKGTVEYSSSSSSTTVNRDKVVTGIVLKYKQAPM